MPGAIVVRGVKCGAALRALERARTLVWIGAALSLGGCAREAETPLPAACTAGPDAIVEALRAAPEPVRLDGAERGEGVALSECLDDTSDGGEVAQIGSIYLAAATELSNAAGEDPDGPEAVRLAYLVGATQRGAARSQGVHYELARRLEQELAVLGRRTPAVRAALRAGRAGG